MTWKFNVHICDVRDLCLMIPRDPSITVLFEVATSRHIVFIYKYCCQHSDTCAGLLVIYLWRKTISRRLSQHTYNIWRWKGEKKKQKTWPIYCMQWLNSPCEPMLVNPKPVHTSYCLQWYHSFWENKEALNSTRQTTLDTSILWFNV